MKRRDFVRVIAAAGIARSMGALAQAQGKTYRIGVLGLADNKSPFEAPLTNGLAKRGYVVDRNVTIERRPAQLVSELVAS